MRHTAAVLAALLSFHALVLEALRGQDRAARVEQLQKVQA
jgi:hypothetical protein